MKKSILLMSIVVMACSTARAQETTLPNVTVYGTATTEVTPDQMNWSLTITNKGADLSRVADAHNKIVAKVLTLLKDNGVKEEKVQTARMEFGENWEYRNNNRVKEGYFASTSVAFELDDFDKYKTLWSGLATIPQVSIGGIAYDHSKRIDYQNETRIKALLAAKQKANALAETLGSSIGEPLLIEEDSSPRYGYQSNFFSPSMARADQLNNGQGQVVLAPGEIAINARVKVSFRLITHEK